MAISHFGGRKFFNRMETEKSNKVNNGLIALAIIAVVIGGYFYFAKSGGTKMKISFPYTQSVAGNNSFACESLLSSDIVGSPTEYLTNGIEGKVRKGTDKVSLTVKDTQTLTFLSGASFQAGETEGVGFTILKNDNKELIAIMYNGTSINSIALNKGNGLAVWLKGAADYLTYGAPNGGVIYLVCR